MGTVFNYGPASAPTAAVAGSAQSAAMSWLFSWSAVEPTRGVFNFAAIDAALFAAHVAGKVSMLRVKGGQESPAWAISAFPSVSFKLQPQGPVPASTITMPITWDVGYLDAFCEWIAAYGTRYNGDRRVAVVQMPGCGRIGEMALGDWAGWTSTSPPPSGAGPEPFTDARSTAAWFRVIDAYVRAFPNTQLAMDVGKPLNSSVSTLSDVIAHCLAHAPHIALQNNGFRGSKGYPLAGYVPQTIVGAQTWGSCAQMNEAVALQVHAAGTEKLSYIELYRADCGPANEALFAAYAAQSPNLPAPGFHRRIGEVNRRGIADRRAGLVERRTDPTRP